MKNLISGDSLSLLDTLSDYLATDGWTLKYRFTPRSAGTAIVLSASAEGDSFRTTATSTTAASWAAGDYSFAKWVERGDERATLETGNFSILPDPAEIAAGTDTRSHLEKTIAAIEAMLEGKATKDVQQYTIGDRQLQHIPLNELLVWRDKYKTQLAGEKKSSSGKKAFGRKIYMRY